MSAKMILLPKNSILNKSKIKYDYVDSFSLPLIDKANTIGITEVGKAFFSSSPKWVEKIFQLRNKLVGLVGLKIPDADLDRKELLEKFNCNKGEKLGLFRVFDKTEDEVIIGEDDKHLNFKISLFLDNSGWSVESPVKNISISTVVEFNNIFGKLYFIPVSPFHKIIAPAMLKGIISQLENN